MCLLYITAIFASVFSEENRSILSNRQLVLACLLCRHYSHPRWATLALDG